MGCEKLNKIFGCGWEWKWENLLIKGAFGECLRSGLSEKYDKWI